MNRQMQPRDISSRQLWLDDPSDDSLSSLDSFSDDSCSVREDELESEEEEEEEPRFPLRRRATFHNGCPTPTTQARSCDQARDSAKETLARLNRIAGRRRSPRMTNASCEATNGTIAGRTTNPKDLLLSSSPMRKFRNDTRGTDSALSHSRSCHSQRRRHSEGFAKFHVADLRSQFQLRRSKPASRSHNPTSRKGKLSGETNSTATSKHSHGDCSGVTSTVTRWSSASSPIRKTTSASAIGPTMRCPRRKNSGESLCCGFPDEYERTPPLSVEVVTTTSSTHATTAKARPQIPARRNHGASFRMQDIVREAQKPKSDSDDSCANRRPASDSLVNLLYVPNTAKNSDSTSGSTGMRRFVPATSTSEQKQQQEEEPPAPVGGNVFHAANATAICSSSDTATAAAADDDDGNQSQTPKPCSTTLTRTVSVDSQMKQPRRRGSLRA